MVKENQPDEPEHLKHKTSLQSHFLFLIKWPGGAKSWQHRFKTLTASFWEFENQPMVFFSGGRCLCEVCFWGSGDGTDQLVAVLLQTETQQSQEGSQSELHTTQHNTNTMQSELTVTDQQVRWSTSFTTTILLLLATQSGGDTTYNHSRSVAGHADVLGPGGRVDAQRHQQNGQTEHAQCKPAGPAHLQPGVCRWHRPHQDKLVSVKKTQLHKK